MSALLGVVIGAPTLRVRGDYLAIITLGFGEIIPVAIRNLGDVTIEIGGWRPVERLNLTGGENGVNPVGRPYLPGRAVRDGSGALVLPDPDHRRRLAVGDEPAARLAAGARLDGHPRGRDGRRLHRRQSDLDQAAGLRAGRLVLGLRRLRLRRQAAGHHARGPSSSRCRSCCCAWSCSAAPAASGASSSAPCSSPCSIASSSRRPRSSCAGSGGRWACRRWPRSTSRCGGGSSSVSGSCS